MSILFFAESLRIDIEASAEVEKSLISILRILAATRRPFIMFKSVSSGMAHVPANHPAHMAASMTQKDCNGMMRKAVTGCLCVNSLQQIIPETMIVNRVMIIHLSTIIHSENRIPAAKGSASRINGALSSSFISWQCQKKCECVYKEPDQESEVHIS